MPAEARKVLVYWGFPTLAALETLSLVPLTPDTCMRPSKSPAVDPPAEYSDMSVYM